MTHAPTTPAATPNADWPGCIQSEFLESPGLRLSLPQACRFWGLEERISAGFLRQTKAGAFVRAEVV